MLAALTALAAGLAFGPSPPAVDSALAAPHRGAPPAHRAAIYNLDGPPQPSFVWAPEHPQVNEPTLFASTSIDRFSPIRSYEWDFTGTGFKPGAATLHMAFTTPADHIVRLRVRAADGLSSIAVATVHMSSPPPGVLSPFPVIRIVGTLVRSGVRVRLLTVHAPIGSAIVASCLPVRHCPIRPARRQTRHAVERLRSFDRLIPAGAKIAIRVSKAGFIGAYTSFIVRHHRLPLRHDLCLNRGGTQPIPCPVG
jgi:hypothetical protein